MKTGEEIFQQLPESTQESFLRYERRASARGFRVVLISTTEVETWDIKSGTYVCTETVQSALCMQD